MISCDTSRHCPSAGCIKEQHYSSVAMAMGLEPREQIAMVGAGGKTSLLFALSEELLLKKKRIVLTTTTKVWHYQALKAPRLILCRDNPAWREQVRETMETDYSLFLGEAVLPNGKVQGIPPTLADELYASLQMDYLLVEADGAAGCSVKAPAPHEPVIPGSSTKVVALMGLEALYQPLEKGLVFRPELVERISGLSIGERLLPGHIARLFHHQEGLFKSTPPGAKKVAFLNKWDLLGDKEKAWSLAELILENRQTLVQRVVIGSLKEGKYHTLLSPFS